ncbi:hypothetical protein GCM10025862_01690 [Arsenicicoccus piscis]|uniref:Aminoacyl-transfer RNA synthetases class-II family profile domain-containing protein n=1 Tax=Arsenicicoccus piscis TaxID=673954 RepID=A0ABQ6HHV9_9MICO|nr:hypothetical protein GCM10025862_01690 [Arsenicicoccus piscis]
MSPTLDLMTTPQAPADQERTDPDVPEQMRVRRDKRARLLAEGVEPYPVSVPRTHALSDVHAGWEHLETGEETTDEVGVAGRVVFLRNTGKLCFATLQEGVGTRLQVMLSLAEVGADSLAAWKADVDLGDHVFVRGRVIRSRRGELSVMADEWRIVSKALRPLPTLHKDLSEETRVRQRYADLIVRQEARDMVRTRATVLRSIRATLDGLGFIEVETPILNLSHGGAAAPFTTHLNAFDVDVTLRSYTELWLKRAVVGGVDKVYEIGKVFRNEGWTRPTPRSSPSWNSTKPMVTSTPRRSAPARSSSTPPRMPVSAPAWSTTRGARSTWPASGAGCRSSTA